jgi:hypothetical protein
MEVAGASRSREMFGRRRMAVRASSADFLNRKAAVHRTGVKLHRLCQTNGKPQRKHAGETT